MGIDPVTSLLVLIVSKLQGNGRIHLSCVLVMPRVICAEWSSCGGVELGAFSTAYVVQHVPPP